MGRIALCNNKKGMTLIEVMISFVILAIVSMAIMKTAILGMKENLRNAIRDDAVNVAEQKMNELKSEPTASIPLGSFDYPPMERKFRASRVSFLPSRLVSPVGSDPNTKQVAMSVSWTYSGQTYTHSVTTIMRGQ